MNEEVKLVFQYNGFVFNKTIDGISHEESLKSQDKGGNCLNWVIGHLVVTRDVLHKALGLETLCDDKTTELYVRGSENISPENALDLKKLIELYNKSQENVMKAMEEKDLRDNADNNKTVAGLAFHEAYHIGQLGLLRRFLGKEGVIK